MNSLIKKRNRKASHEGKPQAYHKEHLSFNFCIFWSLQVCNTRRNPISLPKLLRLHHRTILINTCLLCRISFTNLLSWKRHENSHDQENLKVKIICLENMQNQRGQCILFAVVLSPPSPPPQSPWKCLGHLQSPSRVRACLSIWLERFLGNQKTDEPLRINSSMPRIHEWYLLLVLSNRWFYAPTVFFSLLWIRIGFSANPDSDLAFFVNADPDPDSGFGKKFTAEKRDIFLIKNCNLLTANT